LSEQKLHFSSAFISRFFSIEQQIRFFDEPAIAQLLSDRLFSRYRSFFTASNTVGNGV